MQLTIIALAALSALVTALPGGGDYGSTTKATHTSTGTTCAPTTLYSTSVGYTEHPTTICTTEKAPFTTTLVSYKTVETYVPSTYTKTSYKEVKTSVPVPYTTTKAVVTTIYQTETGTSYSTVQTSSPCPEIVTTSIKSQTTIAEKSTSTGYTYITKTYTTTQKASFTKTVPVTTSTCNAYTKTW